MTPEEARAAGALVGHAVAGGARAVERTHRAVASWALGLLGLPPAPGMIRGGVYAAVRWTGPIAAGAAGHVAALRIGADALPIAATPRGGRIQAALNGAVGDHLDATANGLAVRMSLRRNGCDVPCEPGPLAVAYPGASPRVAVFVHGLCHDENAWTPTADAATGISRATHGDRLAADAGMTSLVLRYNTGRHVSENGADLSRLLSELRACWPVPMTDLVLIGHSMGGLVIRSACAEALRNDAAWPAVTRLIVTLGTPHTGAPLERFAAAVERRLDGAGPTRGLADVFHARSSGIKDLRRGYVSTAEWAMCEQDACPHDHRQPVHPLATAEHLLVASTLTADPGHPVGRALGDLLVRTSSALAVADDGLGSGFPTSSGHLVGGVTHLGLLHDPAVYDQILASVTAAGASAPLQKI